MMVNLLSERRTCCAGCQKTLDALDAILLSGSVLCPVCYEETFKQGEEFLKERLPERLISDGQKTNS
jgi:predicted amidophosphoribosyltransferase